MFGQRGLFTQQNVEKRRVMSVREWAELCAKDELRAPSLDVTSTALAYLWLTCAAVTCLVGSG